MKDFGDSIMLLHLTVLAKLFFFKRITYSKKVSSADRGHAQLKAPLPVASPAPAPAAFLLGFPGHEGLLRDERCAGYRVHGGAALGRPDAGAAGRALRGAGAAHVDEGPRAAHLPRAEQGAPNKGKEGGEERAGGRHA